MDHAFLLNLYVLMFCFCFGYMLSGKQTILKLSTRLMLVVLFLCGLSYLTTPPGDLHEIATVATILTNVLFLAYGISDYMDWLRDRVDAT